jgi:uracil-DNA glycosylase
MDERLDLVIAYFKQQAQLDVPPYIVSDSFPLSNLINDNKPRAGHAPGAFKTAVSSRGRPIPIGALSSGTPLPAHKLIRRKESAPALSALPSSEKRTKLAGLFHETKACQKCALGKSRKSFVFGTGNPGAFFMIIGEAPGEEEDCQGLPFAGAAGNLLTKMLTAIGIDRMRQSFISTIVKCRPPDDRNPEPGEILACSDLLSRQIGIIAPKVMLLLVDATANALFNSKESIVEMRERNGLHFYKDIPVFVTYHPAALLRNDTYRRPAWEDLQKLQKVLKDVGVYDVPA